MSLGGTLLYPALVSWEAGTSFLIQPCSPRENLLRPLLTFHSSLRLCQFQFQLPNHFLLIITSNSIIIMSHIYRDSIFEYIR
jgi:hypothetical protein